MISSLAGIAASFFACRFFSGEYITLAVFISQALTAAILIFALKANIKGVFDKKFMVNIVKIALSSGIALAVIKILYYVIKNDAFESGTAKNLLIAAVISVTGLCSYLGLNLIFKTEVKKS